MKKTLSFFIILFSIFSCCKNEIEVDNQNDFSGNLGIFIDARDGHEYKWVRIGEQIWMAENLAYLPEVNPPSDISFSTPCYYVYDYDGNNVVEAKVTNNYKTYGVLYNWEAAKRSCPKGWYLPNEKDWEKLAQLISDEKGPYNILSDEHGFVFWENVGGHLKSQQGWNNISKNGTDDFGFSALPGGLITNGDIRFKLVEYYSKWWCTIGSGFWKRSRTVSDGNHLYISSNQTDSGVSVRCIKD